MYIGEGAGSEAPVAARLSPCHLDLIQPASCFNPDGMYIQGIVCVHALIDAETELCMVIHSYATLSVAAPALPKAIIPYRY